jgi:monothiol glutaredoxin
MSTDIQKVIHEQVTTHPVVLYMKGSPQFPQCGFSANAVRILGALGVTEPFTVDVLQDQLYIKGEFIGGSDIMTEMYQSGELKGLLG